MSEELDIRSLSVTDAAKVLKVQPKTIRAHIRRGLPLADGRIDLVVYGAWLNKRLQASDLRLQERPEPCPLELEA